MGETVKGRVAYIDIFRGFGIILMIMGAYLFRRQVRFLYTYIPYAHVLLYNRILFQKQGERDRGVPEEEGYDLACTVSVILGDALHFLFDSEQDVPYPTVVSCAADQYGRNADCRRIMVSDLIIFR